MDDNLQTPAAPLSGDETQLRKAFKSVLSWAMWGAAFEGAAEVIFSKGKMSGPVLKAVGRGALQWATWGAVWEATKATFGLHKYENQSKIGLNAAAGVVAGVSSTVIDDLIQRRPINLRMMKYGALIGGSVMGAVAMFQKKPAPQPSFPPIDVTPPMVSDMPVQSLAIAQIPQILDILVEQKHLTPEQQTQVLTEIKNGRAGFAGEIAVANGFVKPEQVEHAVLTQSLRKAEAAITDIQGLSQNHGNYTAPAWLKANWGNNGVNPAAAHPTRADGVSAAANAAQNLVMNIYGHDRENVPALRNGVLAAANLARGIAHGNSAQVPLAKMADAWRATMNAALLEAAAKDPEMLKDANGQPVDIHAYIAARDAEIGAAVQQALHHTPPHKDSGHAR